MSKKVVIDYILIVLLSVILALVYSLFIVPNDFAPAGINGIATMIQYKLGFSIGYMSLIVNVPLCIFAFFLLNKEFAVKTLVYSICYSVAYLLFSKIDLSKYAYDAGGVDTIYPVLIAGAICGFVYGGLFRVNSSTGGTDVISKFVNKKRPHMDFFWVTFIINSVVAGSSYFVYGTGYKPVILCMLYCFMSSFVGSRIIRGGKQAYKFIIITVHAQEITADIVSKLKHSATILDGKGAYSNSERSVIIAVVNKHQIVDMENIIKKYDETFAVVETANETIGNFKNVKKSR